MSEKTNHGSNYKIYCYSNLFNGKRYIGQTYQTLERRAGKDGNNYKKHCLYFGNAIKKDGWENFIPEILESGLTLEEANEREEYWIKRMNTQNSKYGYNIAFGGNTGTGSDTLAPGEVNDVRIGAFFFGH